MVLFLLNLFLCGRTCLVVRSQLCTCLGNIAALTSLSMMLFDRFPAHSSQNSRKPNIHRTQYHTPIVASLSSSYPFQNIPHYPSLVLENDQSTVSIGQETHHSFPLWFSMYLSKSFLLTFLGLASSSTAIPVSTCTSQPWELRDLRIFEATSWSASGSFSYFLFSDPNFDINNVSCAHTLTLGPTSYENSLASVGWRACDGKDQDIEYEVTSYDLGLRRTAVDCGT